MGIVNSYFSVYEIKEHDVQDNQDNNSQHYNIDTHNIMYRDVYY